MEAVFQLNLKIRAASQWLEMVFLIRKSVLFLNVIVNNFISITYTLFLDSDVIQAQLLYVEKLLFFMGTFVPWPMRPL